MKIKVTACETIYTLTVSTNPTVKMKVTACEITCRLVIPTQLEEADERKCVAFKYVNTLIACPGSEPSSGTRLSA